MPAPLTTALTTARLRLPLMDDGTVAALVSGRRLPSWAGDFPATGDVEVAGVLAREGLPSGSDAAFGPRLVVERSTGETIGTAGFFGPPRHGVVEIGYGIVPSRQRRGHATEAAHALIELALAQPGVSEIVAHAESDNAASIRVLEKNALTYAGREGSLVRYSVSL